MTPKRKGKSTLPANNPGNNPSGFQNDALTAASAIWPKQLLEL